MAPPAFPRPAGVVRRAELVIAAGGSPELVRADWVRDGAVVIDVGMNRLADGRLVGDVAFDEVAPKARAITPVPGAWARRRSRC